MSSAIQKALVKKQVDALAKNLGVRGGTKSKSKGGNTSKDILGLDDSDAGLFEDCEDAAPFSDAPGNYPPGLNLFYIDLHILSPEGLVVAKPIRSVYLTTIVASFLNLGIHIFRAIAGVDATTDLALSAVSLVIFSTMALCLYNLAFRACFKSNRLFQRLYFWLSMAYIVLMFLPAFTKFGYFHGWLRLQVVDPEVNARVERMMFGVESMTWTVLLFLQTHASFNMWSFRASHVPGIARNAQPPARPQNKKNGDMSAQSKDPKQARLDEIKARYPNV